MCYKLATLLVCFTFAQTFDIILWLAKEHLMATQKKNSLSALALAIYMNKVEGILSIFEILKNAVLPGSFWTLSMSLRVMIAPLLERTKMHPDTT